MNIGDPVVFTRYEKGEMIAYPANLLTLPDADGKVQLYFYHPDRSRHLGSSDWRDAIDRAVDVLPKEKAGEFIPFWFDQGEAIAEFVDAHRKAFEQSSQQAMELRRENEVLTAQLAATAEGRDAMLQAETDKTATKPSAADLDAVADEEKAKESTKGKNGKAKPVAVGK